jgi:hypothetical protein
VSKRANYGYEKRQKEIKRQKKKEAKEARKRLKRETAASNATSPADEESTIQNGPDRDAMQDGVA